MLNITINDQKCKINFGDMIVSKATPSLKDALSSVTPFELSQDVISGKTKITVDIEKEYNNVR